MRKLLLFLLMVMAGNLYGDNCDLATLQAAVDNEKNGGTITLPQCNSSWTGVLVINGTKSTKGVWIKGSNPAVTNPGQYTIDPKVSRDPVANSSPGPVGPTSATDTTIILNDAVGANGLISFQNLTSSTPVRVSNITFKNGATAGSGGNAWFVFPSGGNNSGAATIQIDNCHIVKTKGGVRTFYVGTGSSSWINLIFARNFVESNDTQVGYVLMGNYGGASQTEGHGSWSEFPYYGQGGNGLLNGWIVYESNTIIKPDSAATTMLDGANGLRALIRNNYLKSGKMIGPHGTEGSGNRGCRLIEMYDNTCDNVVGQFIGTRSGGIMIHDNLQVNGAPVPFFACHNDNYRSCDWRRNSGFQGDADGASVFDKNVTDVDGNPNPSGTPYPQRYTGTQTCNPAHVTTPYIFESGTATGGSSSTMVDSTRGVSTPAFPVPAPPGCLASENCTNYGLVGYSISNYDDYVSGTTGGNTGVADATGAPRVGTYIIDNTANSVTYTNCSDEGRDITFAAGQRYKIHRLIQMLDQMGGGKTVAMSGTGTPVLASTGQPGYPYATGGQPTLEPQLSWRNKYVDGRELQINRTQYPTTYTGVYTATNLVDPVCKNTFGQTGPCTGIDLGLNPSPAPVPPPGAGTPSPVPKFAINKYQAALNGVNYTGNLVFPHPCITSWPTCSTGPSAPANLSPSSTSVTAGTTLSQIVTVDGTAPVTMAATPTPSPLPTWMTISGGSNGTVTLGGPAPTSDSGKDFTFSFKCTNAQGTAVLPFTVSVIGPSPSPNASPSVSITAPTNGQNFVAADNPIALKATASDDHGVASVQFKDGSTNLSPVPTASPYNITANFSTGDHTITAVATDNDPSTPLQNTASVTIHMGTVAAPKPPPVGMYLTSSGLIKQSNQAAAAGSAALNNANCDGIRWTATWADVEQTAGTYTWTYLDDAVAYAAAAGKKCGISVNAGWTSPSWLYSAPISAPSYTLVDDSLHPGQKIPVPGDPVFMARWQSFIAAFGAHFDGNTTVSYIVVTGIGNHDEWVVSNGVQDTAALGNTTAKVNAWKTSAKAIIDAYSAAFPHTTLQTLPVPPFASNAAEDPVVSMKAVSGPAAAAYGCQFSYGIAPLTSSTTVSNSVAAAEILAHWTSNETHGETLDVAPAGGAGVADFNATLGVAVGLKIRCMEIYKADFERSDNGIQGVITSRQADLKAVPTCPAAAPTPTPPASIIISPTSSPGP